MKPAARVRVLIVLSFFLLLELLCRTEVINTMTMIPPSQMLTAIWQMAMSGRLWTEFLSSIRNVGMSFALAILLGTLTGALLQRSRGGSTPPSGQKKPGMFCGGGGGGT